MKKTEDIWFEYHHKLFSFIKSRVTGSEAEDILQDVFVKIHAQINSLKDNTKLESWLFQITRNAVIDYYRSKRPMEKLPDWIEQVHSDETDNMKQELLSCISPMIEQLPEKYRVALNLSELEGKTQKELSNIEGISLSGAKSRVQRGRSLLKSILLDCCEIEANQHNTLVSCQKKEL